MRYEPSRSGSRQLSAIWSQRRKHSSSSSGYEWLCALLRRLGFLTNEKPALQALDGATLFLLFRWVTDIQSRHFHPRKAPHHLFLTSGQLIRLVLQVTSRPWWTDQKTLGLNSSLTSRLRQNRLCTPFRENITQIIVIVSSIAAACGVVALLRRGRRKIVVEQGATLAEVTKEGVAADHGKVEF